MDRLPTSVTNSPTAKTLIAVAAGIGGSLVITDWILRGAFGPLSMPVLGIAAGFVALAILSDWRKGLYLFLVWLIFEDLVRKYMGNNMAIYFGKDVLAGLIFAAFFLAQKRSREPLFRPPFWMPLMLFFWLGAAQVFNPNSPSIFYGLLGMKLYFYYVPLMFLGFALIRTQKELHRFLVFNVMIGALVALVGIIQSIVGLNFLNPEHLAPELQALGQLHRQSPITHLMLTAPPSVFVSAGRFASYLILIFILGLGLAAYQLLRPLGRTGKSVLLSVGIVFVGALMSGSRGAIVYCFASGLILIAAMLWGGPLTIRGRGRIMKAIRRSVLIVAASVIVMAVVYPEAVRARWAFYSETLDPSSPYSQLKDRSIAYPMANLQLVFEYPNWPLGYGIGTGSLGALYVSRLLSAPPSPTHFIESGIGTLLLEFGLPGPALWLFWTFALLITGWRVVRQLMRTSLFPVAFAIWWFSALLLVIFTYSGIQPYQNFIYNAYLWLLIGVLFRLPSLLGPSPAQETPPLSSPIPPAWRPQVRGT